MQYFILISSLEDLFLRETLKKIELDELAQYPISHCIE